jgi:hypothetical protein
LLIGSYFPSLCSDVFFFVVASIFFNISSSH